MFFFINIYNFDDVFAVSWHGWLDIKANFHRFQRRQQHMSTQEIICLEYQQEEKQKKVVFCTCSSSSPFFRHFTSCPKHKCAFHEIYSDIFALRLNYVQQTLGTQRVNEIFVKIVCECACELIFVCIRRDNGKIIQFRSVSSLVKCQIGYLFQGKTNKNPYLRKFYVRVKNHEKEISLHCYRIISHNFFLENSFVPPFALSYFRKCCNFAEKKNADVRFSCGFGKVFVRKIHFWTKYNFKLGIGIHVVLINIREKIWPLLLPSTRWFAVFFFFTKMGEYWVFNRSKTINIQFGTLLAVVAIAILTTASYTSSSSFAIYVFMFERINCIILPSVTCKELSSTRLNDTTKCSRVCLQSSHLHDFTKLCYIYFFVFSCTLPPRHSLSDFSIWIAWWFGAATEITSNLSLVREWSTKTMRRGNWLEEEEKVYVKHIHCSLAGVVSSNWIDWKCD